MLTLILAILIAAALRSRSLLRTAFDGRHSQTEEEAAISRFDMKPEMTREQTKPRISGWLSVLSPEDVAVRTERGMLRGQVFPPLSGDTDAPWAILFHGGAGTDGSQMLDVACELSLAGYRVLVPDLYAHGKSDGTYIGFGALDRYDVVQWTNKAAELFPDNDIYLHGMSMGAASILQSADLDLNKNVRGIIADCGYSDLDTVFRNLVGKLYHLPTMFVDVFEYVNLLKAGYGFKEASSVRSVSVARVPLVYICGDCDRYVPKDMALEIFNACKSEKKLLLVPGAGHAASYMCAKDEYEALVRDFIGRKN